MKFENGTLLESRAVEMPKNIHSMAKRSMSTEELHRYEAVQMYEISYVSDGLRIKGFMALPPAAETHFPCLIFNRGGTGPKGALTPESAFAYTGLYASWGYVAISSQYRGAGGSEGAEEWGGRDVQDAMSLVPLIRSLSYVDQDRIGIIGGSRGGMMALQMLRQLDIFRAAVTIGAPAIIHTLEQDTYIWKAMAKYLPQGVNAREEATRRSAAAWAGDLCKTTPLLVLHGTGDRRVDPEHGLQLGIALQRVQHPYRLVMFENADHIMAGRRKEANEEIRKWVDYYVRDKNPLPKVGPHGA